MEIVGMSVPDDTMPQPPASGNVREGETRTRRRLRTLLLWVLLTPPALGVLLVCALTVAGWWVERFYLRDEIRFGEGEKAMTVHAHGVDFEWWRLNMRADSVWFRSSSVDVHAGATEVGIDWRDGILSMRPSARLNTDSVWLRLHGGDTTTSEPANPDSLAFPDFFLPLAVGVHAGAFVLEDSVGTMLDARGLSVRSRGGQRVRARIDSVRTRWSGPLAPGATARLVWSDADSLHLTATIRNGRDSVFLQGWHAKRPLWRGRDTLAVFIADAAPYYEAFGVGGAVPRPVPASPAQPAGRGGVSVTASATLGDSLTAALHARTRLSSWDVNPAFTLSPQTVELAATWIRDRGTVVLSSAGQAGEEVRLSLTARLTDPSGFPDSTRPFPEQIAASLQGHARNLRVRVRDTLRPADAVIERAAWDGRSLDLALVTGDSSRVEARARVGGPVHGPEKAVASARGTFALTVRPDERWVKVFVGDQVEFQGVQAQGVYTAAAGAPRSGAQGTLTATLAAQGVRAYGVVLDSLRTHHEYSLTTGRYVLKPSRLYAPSGPHDRKPTMWTLSGTLMPPRSPRAGLSVEARLAADRRGSLHYKLASDGTMDATAEDFEATALPYAVLDSLPLTNGVLNGTFRWNPTRKDGYTALQARLLYVQATGDRRKPEPVEAIVAAGWDPRQMTLQQATVSYRGSDLTARARLRMAGKQFYEVATVPAGDYESAAVETGRFDLADILKAVMPESPLDSGVVRGGLFYSDTGGFSGSLALERLGLKNGPEGLTVQTLRLEGRRDTLITVARTTSTDVSWFNDSVYATLTGARGDRQQVRVDAVVGDSLRAVAEGTMNRFAGFKGTLRASGSLALPEGAGGLRDIHADLAFDFPSFVTIMENGTVTTHAFTASYEIPGQPRQRLSLNPSLRSGTLRIAPLSIENDAGQSLTGEMDFSPSEGTLSARVQGDRFALQWTEDYAVDVSNLVINVEHGPGGSRARGSFSTGAFTYADLPLRVQGRLGAVRVDFIRPPLPPGAGRYDRRADTLRISGVLQESELRYRLRNLGDIQRLLGGSAKRRPAVGTPLMLDVTVRTSGSANRINTDMARLNWVGDLSVRGVHPYTLFEGRVSAQSGDFGLEKEAYAIRRLDVKWLNAPVEEGEIHMEARKELASSCTQTTGTTDSCTVITRLDGSLSDLQFSYDSDCGGAYGAGANVAAILYSVQRGCYDGSIAGGETRSYGERALTLLEPTISRGLTQIMGPFWGSFVETAEVTGLASLSGDAPADSLGEALSLALTSREYRRFRIKVRSGYHLNSQDLSSPMENMLALEWRIPIPKAVRDSLWRQRLENNLRAAASVETRPVRRGSFETDEVENKIGLFYNYVYWGEWWARKDEDEE